MLTTRGHTQLGDLRVDTALLLHRTFRAQVIRRSRLLFDTRFARGVVPPRGVATLLVVGRGSTSISGSDRVTEAPVLWVLAENELERADGTGMALRSWGAPALIMDACVPESAVAVPVGLAHGPRPLPAHVADHLEAILEAPEQTSHLAAVLALLERANVVRPELGTSIDEPEPPHLLRLWEVIRSRYESHDTGTYLKLFGELLQRSPRQLQRDTTELTRRFGLGSFRTIAKTLRLRRAVLLLSTPQLSITEIAAQVGYGSSDAMGRAFRDAGLPAPSVVQAAVQVPPVG